MANSLFVRRIQTFSRELLFRHSFIFAQSHRNAGYWNKDWRPGPYPVTPEERAIAAKKYGLRVEDYEPYPDDGFGYGDYPKLQYSSGESRDKNQDWDSPEMVRNYGEPLHVDWDIIQEDKWDPNRKWPKPKWKMVFEFFASYGGLILLYILVDPYPYFVPIMPKQYPKESVRHYTFETE